MIPFGQIKDVPRRPTDTGRRAADGADLRMCCALIGQETVCDHPVASESRNVTPHGCMQMHVLYTTNCPKVLQKSI